MVIIGYTPHKFIKEQLYFPFARVCVELKHARSLTSSVSMVSFQDCPAYQVQQLPL